MKQRKSIPVFFAVVILMGVFSMGVSAAAYSDTAGHWAEAVIEEWSGYGVVEGYHGAFRPDDGITRGEMAAVIDRVFTYTAISENNFKDLDSSAWYAPAILRLNAAGVMLGDQGNVRPMDSITREEAIVMMGRACHINEATLRLNYDDGSAVSDWAQGMVGAMTVLGYISGSNNHFYPQNPITRAEVLTVFNNMKTKGVLVLPGQIRNDENSNIRGIDVSYHNGSIDWQKVKAAGVDYAMIRVGYRGYSTGSIVIDPRFEENLRGAADAGLDIGIYFFSQAITIAEAKEEADYVLSQINPYRSYINYPVVFDWENISNDPTARTNGLDRATLTNEAITFCDTISQNGYTPMVYFNRNLGLNYYDLSRLTAYDFWYAYYGSAPSLSYAYTMLQYSEKGKVDGVSGYVDMDISYRTYAPKSLGQQVKALQVQ